VKQFVSAVETKSFAKETSIDTTWSLMT
jgi:hypothetical protein